MNQKNQHIRVYVQPYCGDTPCADEDEPGAALLVRRITVDGKELIFSEAKINANERDIVSIEVKFIPGRLEVLHKIDPWEDER